MKPRIFYLVGGDVDQAAGGRKQSYRHVDILNRNGFDAYALHGKKGFRYTWFENSTRVISISEARIRPTDFLATPEFYDPRTAGMPKGLKKVIFNQAAHCTFEHTGFADPRIKIPYEDRDVVATMVVSEQNQDYLKHAFPRHPFVRVRNGIDPNFFVYTPRKKKQIAFSVGKATEDVVQIVNILKCRGVFDDFAWAPFYRVPERTVARILKESLICLSFGHQEGNCLLNLEAMSCGCVVIGYHGYGGREALRRSFSYPVECGDILNFAKTIENVVKIYRTDRRRLAEQGRKASEFVAGEYSLKREEEDVVSFWNMVLARG